MDETMSDAVDHPEEQEQEATEQKLINEEYKIWKKNSVFLYDLMYGSALDWPTLTTQWLPDKKPVEDTHMSTHRMILGTHTSGAAQNYLQIASVEIPDFRVPDLSDVNAHTGEVGGHGNSKKPFTFNIVQKINHPGEVNKARYMPSNPDIIASLCVDGRVLIFDRTKHQSTPKPDGSIKFEVELVGHEQEGFGLDWSPLLEGHLVTGNEDATVRSWDMKGGYTKANKSLAPERTWNVHTSTVNDVQWHPEYPYMIGSVSDDLTWAVIDTRMPSHKKALFKTAAHEDAVNCLAFHPKWDVIMATGSADKNIALWDLRNSEKRIHTLENHTDSVIGLEWHPQEDAILASSSYDRRINMWDLSKIGDEQTPDEAEDGPPELLFMHGGFTNRICDFSWNKNDPWVMLAAAEDNQLHIFRPARTLVEPLKKNVNNGEVSD
ncbi:WD40 repeat-like protein [Lindgomyces ingoldianus]|uniref:WD40 repeat-like protein n=1 Tax=Lindgomyces ingoldianus TaxID=673940 RepID=A0ACB6Q9I6_9PLEO|nr:WD40 repeat-like protein [Lindgomyces ingoldianus]KAF2462787.1 WD40 repeat-like protein [Lindgomyces ingoldianus]